ncbi:DUF3247 family protein [Pseudoxanthomonas koreensis]|uniref:DUF3247 family protein n=1 Tax=Pseudoxanthomonas koreensis TaxID=266061 RepID=UPI0035A6684D
MARIAPRVHTDAASIDRLKELQQALDAQLVATLQLRDGSIVSGTIPERPALQQFFGPDGDEGMNGLLLLDVDGEGRRMLWLDDVVDFSRIGSA